MRLRRIGEEDGLALVLALGIMVVLAIVVTAGITYTTSNTRASGKSASRVQARQYAETALNTAVSVLQNQIKSHGDPTQANLLGCGTVTTGPSDCSTITPLKLCFVTGSTCTVGATNSASAYGYYSGTNAQTYMGRTIPASTWLIVGTGYAYDPSRSAVGAQSLFAEVKVQPVTNGDVAAVWNHIFLTAPLVANVCQTTFAGNNLVIDVPLYVIGNLCFTGQNNHVQEIGQPVDVQVGGKLVLAGSGNTIGYNASTPITSGAVVGGCTTVGVTSPTTSCTSGSYSYWVTTADVFDTQAAPEETTTDIQSDYNSFDPGPMHACKAGTSPAGLPSTVFDTDTTYNASAATFELTPAFSYDCQSQSGTTVGRLKWDNTTKTLTIAGSIFIDGNMTVSQSAYYTGTAIIEVAGTVQFNNNTTMLCATSPCNTNLSAWQGSSGNNSMLTLAPLKSNAIAMNFNDNSQVFQGSLWTQPSSTVTALGNNVVVEGPMSFGTITNQNNMNLKPLPTIKNMPVGAPLPPNTGVTLGPLLSVS